jgi:hypothetical protein
VGQDELSEGIRIFLENCIDSVEQLEVLLLLHAEPEREWSLAEIIAELRSTENSIKQRLANLYSRKVLAPPEPGSTTHRFRVVAPETTPIIDELAEHYRIRPNRVIDAIYARPTKALRDLADAFRIWRGRKPQ